MDLIILTHHHQPWYFCSLTCGIIGGDVLGKKSKVVDTTMLYFPKPIIFFVAKQVKLKEKKKRKMIEQFNDLATLLTDNKLT